MKNTLLALMLVSSLFVISCGADATKPKDAYKSQTAETVTGTRTMAFYANAGTVDLTTSYYSLDVGEKVTEIVQVTTSSATGTTTNTVSATKQNADGGIYQFTISDSAATSATVTYKYSKKAAAPMTEKETRGTYTSTRTLTMTTDFNNAFDKSIVSITDKNGKQLIENTDYEYYSGVINIISTTTTYYSGDTFTVRYSSRDINMISEKPLTGNVTVTDGTTSGGIVTAAIQLTDTATYAGRSCYIKVAFTEQNQTTPNYYYHNIVIPSDGIIDVTPNNTGTGSAITATTTGTYELWAY